MDLVIKNGLIVCENHVFKGHIGVNNGKITMLMQHNETPPDALQEFDANGRYVFPGFIDPHLHAGEPYNQPWEDWFHVTQAAAAGGITTVLEHPTSVPPVENIDALQLKLKLANEKSIVDFALWGALTPNSLQNLDDLYQAGCVAFKGFISWCSEEYPSLPDHALYEALRISGEKGYLMAFHAENNEMVEWGEAEMKRLGRRDPLAHLESRESIVELEAINRIIFFARQTGAHAHIVHMTIHEGGALIQRAQKEGLDISCETCPQYIADDSTLLEARGPFAKCTPPLRRPENTKKLWRYVKDGTISMIASDHCSTPYDIKAAGLHDIWACSNGIPGIMTLAPLTLEACMNKNGMDAPRTAAFMSTNTAKRFGLYPRKGAIAIGADADFAIVDINKEWVIDSRKLFYRYGWSPFDGRKVKGSVDATILRGQFLYKDGNITAEKGYGNFINPRNLYKSED